MLEQNTYSIGHVGNASYLGHKCNGCSGEEHERCCGLPAEPMRHLDPIAVRRSVDAGSPIFFEGQDSLGVFILCGGRAKLSASSPEGRVIVVGIAEPGQMLGLSATLDESTYEATAIAIERCEIKFVSVEALRKLMRSSTEASISIAKQLSNSYRSAFNQVCSLGMSETVADRLGRLFLEWSGNGSGAGGTVHIANPFTHEEIAEMVGASRETVTRALRRMRESQLVTLKGSRLVIHDRDRLRRAVGYQCVAA
jgi:CRP/FNR family transcriptional regulator